MATISQKQLESINKLYREGYSGVEIAKKYKVSVDAVYYFFRKNKIARRNRVEARNIAYDRQKASYVLKDGLSEKEKELKTAGIMLYWGEGSKWAGEKIVDFTNSDANMIKTFLSFLRIICGVNETKLRVYLYCYSNQSTGKLMDYWSNETGIPKRQFTKPYVRKDFDNKKIGKMKNGLIHIRYADRKLLDQMRVWIDEYINKFI